MKNIRSPIPRCSSVKTCGKLSVSAAAKPAAAAAAAKPPAAAKPAAPAAKTPAPTIVRHDESVGRKLAGPKEGGKYSSSAGKKKIRAHVSPETSSSKAVPPPETPPSKAKCDGNFLHCFYSTINMP